MAKGEKANAQAGAGAEGLSITPLLEFAAVQDFRYRPNNASAQALQAGRGGERFLTSSSVFANQVLARFPQQFRITQAQRQVRCLPPARWSETGFRGRKVLFLLPSQALGNNVCTLLFFHAFAEHWKPKKLGVFCAQSTADIYLGAGFITVYPLWIGRRELKAWDVVIDLGHLESRRTIEFWPVDMEAELLDLFGLAPSPRFDTAGRVLPADRPPRIGVLPLATSPLRTLPPEATLALLEGLAGKGELTLCLNRAQQQGRLYAEALKGRLPAGVALREGFESIGDLLDAVRDFDYIVAADSGPAHMAKLYGTPGVAVYTSAPGDVLQGRFRNLVAWTVPFEGPWCRTPCGLAKLRQAEDGRIGCMGSLGLPVEALPTAPTGQQPGVVERLLREPVPCVRALRDDPEPLVRFVLDDLARRPAG